MATARRRTDPDLIQRLFEQPHGFEFFQAVRLIERLSGGRVATGGQVEVAREAVRFRSRISLDFPPSQVHSVTRSESDGDRVEMLVTFMGLAGPHGVLPRHYTELLLERIRERDLAFRDFLDIFNHRLVSLFYRAWEKHRCAVLVERSLRGPREGGEDLPLDPFSSAVLDLVGMSSPGLRAQLDLDRSALLFFAGLLAQRPHSASALRGLLSGYFEVPAKVLQFTGAWLPMSAGDRTRLGIRGANGTLGVDAIVGDRVWDQQAKFRLRFGPLGFEQFCQLLPSGRSFAPAVAATRMFVGQECDFDVQLVLRGEEVPYCKLGEGGERAPRLGWSAWLKTREFDQDSDAVVLHGSGTLAGAFPAGVRVVSDFSSPAVVR